MSYRVEWFHAESAGISIVPRGTEFGEHEVTEEVAIILDGDEGAAFEGTRDQIRARLYRLLEELERAGASDS